MALFDAFTGSAGRRASDAARGFAGTQFERNLADVGGMYSRLGDLARERTGTMTGITERATEQGKDYLAGGERSALDRLRRGAAGATEAFRGARGAFSEAGDRYAPVERIADKYRPGTELLLQALGARGPEGSATAREAFESSLQPDYMVDRGLDAISRRAAAAGGGTVFGGNIDRAAQDYGMDVARQQSADWMDRLAGLISPELAAATGAAGGRAASDVGRAGVFGQEAGLSERLGQTEAGLAMDVASRLQQIAANQGVTEANIQNQLFNDLQAFEQGRGVTELDLRQKYGQDVVNSIFNRAASTGQASRNIIGAATDILGAGATALGGMNLGNIFSRFGGGGRIATSAPQNITTEGYIP